MEKHKPPITPAGRLWRFWQRQSLWIYAAGALYLLLNILVSVFAYPAHRFIPGSSTYGSAAIVSGRSYILLSMDEALFAGLLALVAGLVMLVAVIGYARYSRRWLWALGLFVAGFLLWMVASASVLSYIFTPRVASVAYGDHVYQLASSIFTMRQGLCGDADGMCGGNDFQLFECNSLALMCQPEGEMFYASRPRLEIVDGVLRVLRYTASGDFVEVIYEVP